MYDILNSPSKALLEDLQKALPEVKINKFDKPGPPRFEVNLDDIFKRSYLKFLGKHRAGHQSDMVDAMMQNTRGKNELLAIAKEITKEES